LARPIVWTCHAARLRSSDRSEHRANCPPTEADSSASTHGVDTGKRRDPARHLANSPASSHRSATLASDRRASASRQDRLQTMLLADRRARHTRFPLLRQSRGGAQTLLRATLRPRIHLTTPDFCPAWRRCRAEITRPTCAASSTTHFHPRPVRSGIMGCRTLDAVHRRPPTWLFSV